MAKGRISKRVLQENKHIKFSEKYTYLAHPLICTRTYVYQYVKNVSFSENFAYVLNE